MNYLSREADAILRRAKDVARRQGLGYVGTEHLLLAIVQEGTSQAAVVLRELGANEYTVQARVDELNRDRGQESWVTGRLPGTPNFRDVITRAANASRGTGNWQIASEHLVLGLLEEKGSIGCKALNALGVTTEMLRAVLARQRAAASKA